MACNVSTVQVSKQRQQQIQHHRHYTGRVPQLDGYHSIPSHWYPNTITIPSPKNPPLYHNAPLLPSHHRYHYATISQQPTTTPPLQPTTASTTPTASTHHYTTDSPHHRHHYTTTSQQQPTASTTPPLHQSRVLNNQDRSNQHSKPLNCVRRII